MNDIWIRVVTMCWSQRRRSNKGWKLNETVLKQWLNWSNIVSRMEKAGLILGILISWLVLNSHTTFESFCQQSHSAHLNPYIILLLLLAFVSPGDNETLHPDLVGGWVTAPAVAVQTSSRTADPIAVVAGESCPWLCGRRTCPLLFALSPLFALLVYYSLRSLFSHYGLSIFPSLMSCLQTSLYRWTGHHAGLLPQQGERFMLWQRFNQ